MLKTSHEPAMKPPNSLCMAVRCSPPLLWSLARYCDLPATRLQPCPRRRSWGRATWGVWTAPGTKKGTSNWIDGDASCVRRAGKNNATAIMSTVSRSQSGTCAKKSVKVRTETFRACEMGVERTPHQPRRDGYFFHQGLRKGAPMPRDTDMMCKEIIWTPPRRLHKRIWGSRRPATCMVCTSDESERKEKYCKYGV